MNLYYKKQRWKIILVLLAILLVFASFWFSNSIVKKVANKEKERVTYWGDAIKRKAHLVNITNSAFDELRENERQKVNTWILAMKEANKDLKDYSFVVSVLQQSSTLPMVIVNQDENIETTYNLTEFDSLPELKKQDTLKKLIKQWKNTHPPLTLNLYDNVIQKVYYYDSKKLEDLSKRKDSLFNAFSDELVNNDDLVPVIFIDKNSREVIGTNIDDIDFNHLDQLIADFKKQNDSIVVDLGPGHEGVIYFEHSPELTQLKYFPFIQFMMIGLFILIGYLVFSTFRKAEQDQVWVGMAKETAHQLGTPISSLMAWVQLLESQGIENTTITEMNKDIDRLNTVTNRFSKIGSKAILKPENIVPILKQSIDYLQKRISDKVALNFYSEQDEIIVPINAPLLEWVIENIVKNAVDAMEGKGAINVKVKQLEDNVIIDIEDNGKGIPSSKLKAVFQPGYTTKTRGWGLGLSLVKRIIEEFHKGKIVVHESEPNKGTTFRITLKSI
jgi:signal transduction histidine kinase